MSLSHFDFIITYSPGCLQWLSDALSMQLYLAAKEGKEAYDQQCMILLKPKHFYLCAVGIKLSFFDEVRETSCFDTFVLDIKQPPNNDCDKLKSVNNLLYFKERLYILEGHSRSLAFVFLKSTMNF